MSTALAVLREPELACWSGLRPIPKGSLRHIGNGVLREDNARSAPHKQALVNQLTAARLQHPRRREFPLRCPVEVTLSFYFTPPRSAGRHDRPSTTRTGDIDKLCRLVLDALTQSGVIVDDSRVVGLLATAWYGDRPGTRLHVAPARDNTGAQLPGPWPGGM